jgi:hypothetical protein
MDATFSATWKNVNTAITHGEGMVEKVAKSVFYVSYMILFMNSTSTFELRKLHKPSPP